MSTPSDPGLEGRAGDDHHPAAGEPDVIIVPYRPARGAAKLLPPVLIVVLGVGFLAYRSRSADWRGLSALFERRPAPVRSQPPTTPAPPPADAPVLGQADPAPAPDKEKEKEKEKGEGQEKPKVAGAAQDQAAKPGDADPLDDIQREAEKTKQRLAELEKHKEREAQKLDETADERERADRLARRDGIDRQIGAMQEQLRRQMAEMQRRAMESMAEMERDFGGGRMPRGFAMPPGFALPRGFGGIPDLERRLFNGLPPGPFGMLGPGMIAPQPGRPQPGRDRVWRDPRGGVGRFREFQGPGGLRGLEFLWQGGDPAALDDDAPPPPAPRPQRGRRFD